MITTAPSKCQPCTLGNHTGSNGTPGCQGHGCQCSCQRIHMMCPDCGGWITSSNQADHIGAECAAMEEPSYKMGGPA